MDGSGGVDGPSVTSLDSVKTLTAKTYDDILRRKEARLQKDALLERRAQQLTRHFVTDREAVLKEKNSHLSERSKISYEMSMQKAGQNRENAHLLKQMLKEEKKYNESFMRQQVELRKQEEEDEKAAKLERDYWMQARSVAERLEAERRKTLRDEEQERRKKDITDRMKNHKDEIDRIEKEDSERVAQANAKRDAAISQNIERRKAAAKKAQSERTEEVEQWTSRNDGAAERRKSLLDKTEQALQMAHEKRVKQVSDNKRMQDESLEGQQKRIAGKLAAAQHRAASAKQAVSDNAVSMRMAVRSTSDAVSPAPAATAAPDLQRAQTEDATPQQDHSRALSGNLVSWSQEMIKANSRVHKEYVIKTGEFNEASLNPKSKQFRALADAGRSAETGGPAQDDAATARMRSLHNMYIAKTPRGASRGDSPPGSPGRRETYAAARPPRTRQVTRCDLCEREIPPDSTGRSVMRKTVERLRHKAPAVAGKTHVPRGASAGDRPGGAAGGGHAMGTAGPSSSANAGPGAPAADVRDASATADLALSASLAASGGAAGSTLDAPSKNRGGSPRSAQLYDYEVKLCTACYHFVRITG